MEVEHINANKKDIEEIYRYNKELLDLYEKIPVKQYNLVLEELRKKITNSIDDYKCILCDGKIAGYYRILEEEFRTEIDDLYIFENFQNQGIGTKIISDCVSKTKNPVFLYVFVNNAGAVNLYKRLGFQVIESIGDKVYKMVKRKENR